MDVGVMVISWTAFALLLFVLVGGPILLVDWSRKRRQAAIECQIALTDAIDGQVGAIVSPVVSKPLFGPWDVEIAAPLQQPGTVAGILSVVDEVFGDVVGPGSDRYRIFLTATQDALRETRAPSSPKRWARAPLATA